MIVLILAGGKNEKSEFEKPKAVIELLNKPLINYILEDI